MATKPKEGEAKSKPCPATTTPSPQKKRSGTAETTTKDATTSTAPEKPVPNYLRPTISSCRDNCQRPIKHQHHQAESTSLVAGKPLAGRKLTEKASSRSSSQPKDRTRGPISQQPRPSSVSPKAMKKPSSSQPAEACSRASTKRTSSGGATKEAIAVTQLEMKKEEQSANSSNESEDGKLDFQQESGSSKENEESGCKENEEAKGKDSPTMAYNTVVEVEERRRKVKALVGAFETVSPRKGEEAHGNEMSPRGQQKKVNSGETGQNSQQQPEETGQTSQQIAEDLQEVEASQQKDVKDEENGHESQQEETGQTGQHDAEEEDNNESEVHHGKSQEQEEAEKGRVFTESKENNQIIKREMNGSTEGEDASPKERGPAI